MAQLNESGGNPSERGIKMEENKTDAILVSGIKNLKIGKQLLRGASYLLAIGITLSLSSCTTTSFLADGAKIVSIDDMDLDVPDANATMDIVEETVEEVEEINPLDLVDLSECESTTLAHALKEAGYEYSFEARKALAERYGIKNYVGTTDQNEELFAKLQVPLAERTDSPIKGEIDSKKDSQNNSKKENSNNQQNANNQQNTIIKNDPIIKNETEKKDPSSEGIGSGVGNGSNQGNSSGSNDGSVAPENPSKPNNPTTNPGNPSKPSNPGQDNKPNQPNPPAHTHNYGDWYSKNDDLEGRKCSCGHEETRNHKYGEESTSYSATGNGQHKIVSSQSCVNCGHTKNTSTTENCSFGKLLTVDTVNETWQDVCGQTKIIPHNFGTKTEQVDGTWKDVTYCTNGCNYSMSAPHNHNMVYGEWQIVKTPDECRKRAISCSECGYTEEEVNGHSWNMIQAGDPAYGENDVYQCDDCGLIKDGDEYASLTAFDFDKVLQFYADRITEKSNVKVKVIGRC